MQELKIRGEMIRLGQLLKLGGVVESGADGKELLATGAVVVNGEVIRLDGAIRMAPR